MTTFDALWPDIPALIYAEMAPWMQWRFAAVSRACYRIHLARKTTIEVNVWHDDLLKYTALRTLTLNYGPAPGSVGLSQLTTLHYFYGHYYDIRDENVPKAEAYRPACRGTGDIDYGYTPGRPYKHSRYNLSRLCHLDFYFEPVIEPEIRPWTAAVTSLVAWVQLTPDCYTHLSRLRALDADQAVCFDPTWLAAQTQITKLTIQRYAPGRHETAPFLGLWLTNLQSVTLYKPVPELLTLPRLTRLQIGMPTGLLWQLTRLESLELKHLCSLTPTQLCELQLDQVLPLRLRRLTCSYQLWTQLQPWFNVEELCVSKWFSHDIAAALGTPGPRIYDERYGTVLRALD